MIPLFLDPSQARVALIGRGDLAARRVQWLKNLGAKPVVFAEAPNAALRAEAGFLLAARFPDRSEMRSFHAIWIADLEPDAARNLANIAREEGVLVNVEDVKSLCDFHTPAVVRRGRLTLAAGTGGASPAAAAAVREVLDETFSEEWTAALDELAEARESMRGAGADLPAISADARARLRRRELIRAR